MGVEQIDNKRKGKDAVVKEMWLEYFNDYLYSHGAITDKERLKMKNLIYQNINVQKKVT